MSTIRANNILDSAGGNTATINGITPALASQAQAEAGTDNTTLMTPLRTEQHMLVNAVGWGQTWQTVTRTAGVSYQNTTGKPIQIAVKTGGSSSAVQVSVDNVTWITVDSNDAADYGHSSVIIPPNYYYRVTVVAAQLFTELR